ncbi:MAG: hypothetical protein KDN22_23810 [Verrucomicrobiae bacterium]|nr:hypothetical protein [Verrucomicrobiae bacterium]
MDQPPPIPPAHGQPSDFSYQGNATVSLNPRTSRLSIACLVLGIASVPLVFLCIGLGTGVMSMILGLVSLIVIRGSKGRLKGKWASIAGISLSLAAFVIYGTVANHWQNNPTEVTPASPAAAAMHEAEMNIAGAKGGVARGNSAEAISLASAYSKLLGTLNEEYFVRSKEARGPSLTGGKFLVHCHLAKGKCAFLVHVPSYRKYEDGAKEQLAGLAWMAAHQVVASAPESVPQGADLGVGLRGVLLYGAIMVGTVDINADDPESLIIYNGQDENHLEPFFAPAEEEFSGTNPMPGDDMLTIETQPEADDQ